MAQINSQSQYRRLGVITRILILMVRIYQKTLGPLLGGQCRFCPSCSNYAILALRRHGAMRGSWLTLRRLLRCHPWGSGGDDPVPDREQQFSYTNQNND